jgi:hypothetical protein
MVGEWGRRADIACVKIFGVDAVAALTTAALTTAAVARRRRRSSREQQSKSGQLVGKSSRGGRVGEESRHCL